MIFLERVEYKSHNPNIDHFAEERKAGKLTS